MQVKKQQGGFTLIELVVVIVILGILAATALPKFVNIQTDAQTAAVQGVAGAVSSGFSVNYAAYLVNPAKAQVVSGTGNVTAAAGAVMQGGWPAGYTVSAAALSGCGAAGNTQAITVSNVNYTLSSQTAAATVICTG